MGAIERRWSNVVLPASVRIGDVVKIFAVARTTDVGVNRTRKRIGRLHLQPGRYSPMEVNLKPVVVFILAIFTHAISAQSRHAALPSDIAAAETLKSLYGAGR